MCGITGIHSLKKDMRINPDMVVKMRDSLWHRGPDDCGIYISPDQQFCFGHNRLSIIDLSDAAHQPMSDQDGKIWISYNGEIYNYRQLQNELKEKGYAFRSKSDTEVIIQGYWEWGIDELLKRLRGMFAFAIYDIRDRIPRLILARDRFGIKPLYYYQDEKYLVFSSEVKTIIKSGIIPFEKNPDADIAFLIFGHIPVPFTTVKNVYSLPVGSYMLLENGNRKIKKYYELLDRFKKPKLNNPKNEIYDILFSILNEVVDMHLVSDAPLGIFLSGGIDSSCLVALASRNRDTLITTLSVIFDEKEYSENLYQRLIADKFKTDHREIKITEGDFYNEINKIFEAMDQPTVNGVNTYFVSQAAKQAGLKTVLSGLGADEVFCGYESFKKICLLKAINYLPKLFRLPFALTRDFNDRWRKLVYLKNVDYLNLYLIFRGLFIPGDVAKILDVSEKEINNVLNNFQLSSFGSQALALSPIDWLSYMEINFYLQNQLLKDTDFMSMYHSLETRVPFLDHVLMEFIISVDSSLKVNRKIPKHLLIKSTQNILPNNVIFRKKQGFVFPFDIWLKKKGKGFFKERVSESNIRNKKFIEYLWHMFEQNRLHWSRVWALVVMSR